jgi:hypothetical protein
MAQVPGIADPGSTAKRGASDGAVNPGPELMHRSLAGRPFAGIAIAVYSPGHAPCGR